MIGVEIRDQKINPVAANHEEEKMLKKMLMAAMAVAALAAVVAPSASATILDKGVPIAANQTETFTGTAEFQSAALGKVHCNKAEGQIQLLAGQTNGTVQKFQVAEPTVNCQVHGALGATCGTFSLHQVNLTKHAKASVVTHTIHHPAQAQKPTEVTVKNAITVQDIELFNLFGSTAAPCIELELKSTATRDVNIDLDNAAAISTGQLTGSLETNGFGPVSVAGVLHAHVPGTYGVKLP